MTSLKLKYVPLVQKPECCAVTCFQMILFRNGFGLFDQERLAKYFGVKINKKHENMFSIKLDVLSNYNYDEGISTLDSVNKVNEFFLKNNINLIAEAKKISEIDDLKKFIESNIVLGNDLWVEYKGHNIHKYDQMEGKYLHDSLIESIDDNDNEIVIIDPSPDHKPRIKIKIKSLFDSLSTKFGKETGFLIISKK